MLRIGSSLAVALASLAPASLAGDASPVLGEVEPTRIRAQQLVTLEGQGFGAWQPAASEVLFVSGEHTVAVRATHVWRDDFIQVLAPAGLPGGPLVLQVVTAAGASPPVDATYLASSLGAGEGGQVPPLRFIERTQLANHFDQSGFLGQPDQNMARTKDAHVGDANGDGWPDLIDNNSDNQLNGTHAILRLNQGGQLFTAMDWEPTDSGDTGTFAVSVPPGGDFVGDAICYDADFWDLNNDQLPDWIMAGTGVNRVRVLMNDHQGVPGQFEVQTGIWNPPGFTPPGSPDDICAADVNADGFLDIGAAFRFSDDVGVHYNDAGTSFSFVQILTSTVGGSMHDVFFIDANDDSFWDVGFGNESGDCQIHFHDQDLATPGFSLGATLNAQATAAVVADLNGDQLHDVATCDFGTASRFLNVPANPGTFAQATLPGVPTATLYDMEAGDLDLDGDVDLISAIITTAQQNTVRIWSNDGNGNFTNLTNPGTLAMLPQAGDYQRLSADLIDYDLDGDLDLYVTGADGAGAPGQGFGMVANQFWENRVPPPGQAIAYGSAVNPPGSITVESGSPSLGGSITIGVDNPLGTQAAGSPSFLSIAATPDPAFPAGTLIPGWGMAGPGANGELLVGLSPPPTLLVGPVWNGAGNPAPFVVPIPFDTSLIGASVFTQGTIVDPVGAGGVVIGLTEAFELLIGT